MKSIPRVSAALSMALANCTKSAVSLLSQAMATGVTETRLFMMGMPNSRSICCAVGTSLSALRQTLSYIFRAHFAGSVSEQSLSDIPMVTVLISRCCWLIISIVESISSVFIMRAT